MFTSSAPCSRRRGGAGRPAKPSAPLRTSRLKLEPTPWPTSWTAGRLEELSSPAAQSASQASAQWDAPAPAPTFRR